MRVLIAKGRFFWLPIAKYIKHPILPQTKRTVPLILKDKALLKGVNLSSSVKKSEESLDFPVFLLYLQTRKIQIFKSQRFQSNKIH